MIQIRPSHVLCMCSAPVKSCFPRIKTNAGILSIGPSVRWLERVLHPYLLSSSLYLLGNWWGVCIRGTGYLSRERPEKCRERCRGGGNRGSSKSTNLDFMQRSFGVGVASHLTGHPRVGIEVTWRDIKGDTTGGPKVWVVFAKMMVRLLIWCPV